MQQTPTGRLNGLSVAFTAGTWLIVNVEAIDFAEAPGFCTVIEALLELPKHRGLAGIFQALDLRC